MVKKGEGDFNRALAAGFGINNYCENDRMWLVLPSASIEQMEDMIEHYHFEKLSPVEYKD